MEETPMFLSDQALRGLEIAGADILDAIEAAIRAESAGALLTAPKSALLPGDGRYVMATLSTSDSPALTVVKCVTVAPENPSRGLAGIEGAILLCDSATGRLVAVMDAGWITGVRTAGLSAVAARRLAHPNATRIGFVGCGVQARSHLDAFAELFPLREAVAYGRGAASRDLLLSYAAAKGMTAREAATPDDALEGADIVVTSITLDYSIEPFLDARRLKPGAFAAITDLGIPWRPDGLRGVETIVIDDLEQEAASPKKMVDPVRVAGDLKALLADGARLRFDPARRSAFIFRGLALGDFAVAALAYRRAAVARL